jgi:sugar O-acyltransferase (sialic acid O-acetyltransferase NeuD family)
LNSNLVLFGTGQIAELAQFYFESDSPYKPVAFTVHGEFVKEATYLGLPVVAFEELEERFPQEDASVFVALSYKNVNKFRRSIFEEVVSMGYEVPSYVSSRATVLVDMSRSKNCFVLEENTIQPFVRIGDNVFLWSGNHIGHHSVLESHCYIASQIVISGNCRIEEESFIGVNATLHDGVTIGAGAIVAAGALIKRDVESGSVMVAPSAKLSERKASEVNL